MDSFDSEWGPVADRCKWGMNVNVPYQAGNFLANGQLLASEVCHPRCVLKE